MKKFLFIIFFLICSKTLLARHVAGGELYYEWISNGNTANTYKYRVTLRLFRDCNSTGPQLQNEVVTVGIYENNGLYTSLSLPLSSSVETISLNTTAFPCLVGNPNVCYEVAYYINTIDLPINTVGYTLARTGCCRIDAITNTTGGNSIGSTYVTKIPGTSTLPIGHNSSPQFNVRDTALVCAGKIFNLDFGAQDMDGDNLTYSFCDAFTAPSGSNTQPPQQLLTLNSVPYISPFSGTDPLGGVNINPTTGIINGSAPGVGQYIVSVCITEWRNGIPFTEHRKDFILKVQNCDFVEANLPDKIIQCDSFSVLFQNQSTSSAIQSYLWTFGEPSSSSNSSTQPTPTHTYADTGRYIANLQVTGPNGCVGKDSTLVLVYPGFNPNFTVTGSCYQSPFNFKDVTTAAYGIVNSWRWNFGDLSTIADTSHLKNPTYLYAVPGNVNVQLTVGSSKGCEKTILKPVAVRDKPAITLPFKDTLLCTKDSLQIFASGNGSFSWYPNYNIINANSTSPIVYPKDTTTYYVTVVEQGCVGTDSVTIYTLDFIKVELGNDSSICKTDTFRLKPISYAASYNWLANTGEVVAPIKYPLVQPLVNTTYYVNANLGTCQDKDSIKIKVAPYPTSNAGKDTSICFGDKVFLHGSIIGSSFTWAPNNALVNSNTLNPIATPSKPTYYILTVKDTIGCPKPSYDSIFVDVIKPVVVNAGKDTSIVYNQPLQLNALVNFDNGVNFLWSPSTGLNNTVISNPIATLFFGIDSIKYLVKATTTSGCVGVDEIIVRVFRTEPEIFVPTAFTPNADKKNDILKPICVGIKKLDYFRVYNRWGQIIFETTEFEKGWDGTISGTMQPSGTYVFAAQGIDYTGKIIFRKGTTVLIR